MDTDYVLWFWDRSHITSYFGETAGRTRPHSGTDYAHGTVNIPTPFHGPIVGNGNDPDIGFWVKKRIQELGNVYFSIYHMRQAAVGGHGTWLNPGDVIGVEGQTGRESGGIHTHAMITVGSDASLPWDDQKFDPVPVIEAAINGAPINAPGTPYHGKYANPVPVNPIGPKQRKAATAVNIRPEPLTSADILGVFPTGGVLDVEAYVHEENVGGNDVWFYRDGQFFWSGGFEDQGTHDLPEMVWPPEPEPDPYEGIPERLDAIDQAVLDIRKLIEEKK